MKSSQHIVCPNCKTEIDIDEVLTKNLENSIKEKYDLEKQQIASEYAKRDVELKRQVEEFEERKKNENQLFLERVKKETELQKKKIEEELFKKLSEENKTKIDFLEKQQIENAEKLKLLNEKEFEVLNLKKKLDDQKEQEEFKLKKQRLELEIEMKEILSVEILGKERERHDLEKRELEKQLHDQKKLTEQMTRKLEQGSMQSQGEVQEIALEEVLRNAFPFDEVREVPKGTVGADCIFIVKNEIGIESGKIIFESKRTKNFVKDWIPKLKSDSIKIKADVCILVTQVLPDDMKHFDQREGVWICRLNEVIQLVKVIREGIINVARAHKSQENKGEKKEMLYTYFTSNEFLQQMRAINEAYLYLKTSIDKERFQMEKIWKEREKQIDKVLLNNSYLLGTIKGIAGSDIEDINLLD